MDVVSFSEMNLKYAIAGLIAGIFISGSDNHWLLGAIAGAAIGILLARIVLLEHRIRRLESITDKPRHEDLLARSRPADSSESELSQTRSSRPRVEPGSAETSVKSASVASSGQMAKSQKPAKERPLPIKLTGREQVTPGPSILRTFITKAMTWISTGNVPVKVGVIVTFIGVSFLLKYAIDRKLLVVALEFRLLAVAAAGIALLVIGWRLRSKTRVYALSLQGGGIGILFLTTFAALQLWQLLPPALAFFLLVILTILTGSLAVLQNSRSLAILGVVGGFLAPVLASTGQGNHVVLFSYYLVLNGAILGIAWFRAWRGLNLIGWVFTFLIGSLWGYQYYKPELLISTQPFLILYFLLYQVVAILFAQRQPPSRLGYVDGTLVFGTPVIVFALQAALVDGYEYGLAISAALVSIFYALVATWLWRSKGQPLRLLTESFMALAVVFATITLPLALDARWTSAAWALEGAALVWISIRQHRQLARLAGIALVFLSGGAFIQHGWQQDAGWPLLNGNVLGGLLISLSALFASRKLEDIDLPSLVQWQNLASTLLFVFGALWWLGTGWMEIDDRVESYDLAGHHNRTHLVLLFVALSMGAWAWLGKVRDWAKMRQASLTLLPLLVPFALTNAWDYEHLLVGAGWLIWPLALAIQVFVLRVLDEYDEPMAASWHFGFLLLLTGLIGFEITWWVDLVASSDWAYAAAASVPGVLALLVWRFSKRPAWPVPVHPLSYFGGSIVLVTAQVISLTALAILQPGNPDPWPYIPLLNPFDLALLFAILTSRASLASIHAQKPHWQKGNYINGYKLVLAVTFIVLTSFALIRGVHHYTAVAWNTQSLFNSTIVQTVLSIYWGLLGFSGMIKGARSSQRPVWLTGAAFMALVVVKLFVIDLGNSGTVERIISFIGIGALLLVVGYLAPVPPRITRDNRTG